MLRFLALFLVPLLAAADPNVASINSEPVSAAEYRLVMGRKVATVYDEFKRTQNLDDHSGYWCESSGEDGPLARLRELTREELIRIKVYQGLAKQKGLVSSTTFADFQAQFDRENGRRLVAKKAGEVVYGPVQYRLATYYYICFGDVAYKLKESFAKEAEPEISEEEIRKFYDENSELLKGKSLDEVLRQRILSALAEEKAEARLDALCASAKVELDEAQLRDIVPRKD